AGRPGVARAGDRRVLDYRAGAGGGRVAGPVLRRIHSGVRADGGTEAPDRRPVGAHHAAGGAGGGRRLRGGGAAVVGSLVARVTVGAGPGDAVRRARRVAAVRRVAATVCVRSVGGAH